MRTRRTAGRRQDGRQREDGGNDKTMQVGEEERRDEGKETGRTGRTSSEKEMKRGGKWRRKDRRWRVHPGLLPTAEEL